MGIIQVVWGNLEIVHVDNLNKTDYYILVHYLGLHINIVISLCKAKHGFIKTRGVSIGIVFTILTYPLFLKIVLLDC